MERILRRLAEHDVRLYRPKDAKTWLRNVLGDTYEPFAAGLPTDPLSGLSDAQRKAIAKRLYSAVWRTMRDILGAEDPDVQEAARGLAPENGRK
jgi:hypothetical protein